MCIRDRSGYRPEKTIVFCAMAAEEWGMADSKYDWSTGAWQQVSVVHPEWQGKVAADFNLELPAHAHGKKDAIRTVYEYADFLESLLEGTGVGKDVYPEGVAVLLSLIHIWPMPTFPLSSLRTDLIPLRHFRS